MKKISLFLVIALLTLSFAGCGGTATPSNNQASGNQAAASNDKAAPSDNKATTSSDKKLIIGFSQHRIAGSDWYKMLIAGAQYQADKQGVTLLVSDANGDAVRQNSDIQNMLSRGAQGIVVNALDPRGLAGTISQLKTQGIPVSAVNSRLSEDVEKQTLGFVAEDQLVTAAQAGEQLAKNLAAKYGPEENVKVAIIGGYSGEATTAMRLKGFENGFNGYFEKNKGPKITLLPVRYGEWLPDKARGPIQQVATANPDLKAVFSMSDVMMPGIKQGLKDAGILDKVIIVSYDGSMAVVKEMMDDPKGPIQGTISNTPFIQGAQAVQLVINALKGQKVDLPNGTLYTDSVLITPENAKEYYDAAKPYYYSQDALDKVK